jgi:hypothetical protein
MNANFSAEQTGIDAVDFGGQSGQEENVNFDDRKCRRKCGQFSLRFHLILQLESEYLWDYGQASSVAYPLAKIDTINEETGDLNEKSALYLVVYGESQGHLEMLDGLLEDLLEVKWEAFAKRRSVKLILMFFNSTAIIPPPPQVGSCLCSASSSST